MRAVFNQLETLQLVFEGKLVKKYLTMGFRNLEKRNRFLNGIGGICTANIVDLE